GIEHVVHAHEVRLETVEVRLEVAGLRLEHVAVVAQHLEVDAAALDRVEKAVAGGDVVDGGGAAAASRANQEHQGHTDRSDALHHLNPLRGWVERPTIRRTPYCGSARIGARWLGRGQARLASRAAFLRHGSCLAPGA